MSSTFITTFTQAALQAQQWINELAGNLNWRERHAYPLLRSVLHALRDWLPLSEMTDLAAQLPVIRRGICFESWKPLGTPVSKRKKGEFVARIQADFSDDLRNDPDAAVTAVCRLPSRHLSHGEIVQVQNSMAKSMRELWAVA